MVRLFGSTAGSAAIVGAPAACNKALSPQIGFHVLSAMRWRMWAGLPHDLQSRLFNEVVSKNENTRPEFKQTSLPRRHVGRSAPNRPLPGSSYQVSGKQFLLTVRLHRVNFTSCCGTDPESAALPKCIEEPSMVRFYSSIYSDNKMLIRQMSRVALSWDSPPNRCRASNEDRKFGKRSRPRRAWPNRSESLFLVQRHDISAASCRNSTALRRYILTFLGVARPQMSRLSSLVK